MHTVTQRERDREWKIKKRKDNNETTLLQTVKPDFIINEIHAKDRVAK